jgi:hypothetical protein
VPGETIPMTSSEDSGMGEKGEPRQCRWIEHRNGDEGDREPNTTKPTTARDECNEYSRIECRLGRA